MSAHRCCLQLFTKTGVFGAGWTCRNYVYLLRYVNLIYYVNKPFAASFEVIWMNIFKKSNRKRGFSLIEVVIVVAVIGILLAVAVPNIIAYYRELKLVELDDSARTIFMAAQNEISAILAADKDGVPDGTDGSCKYPSPVAGGKVDDRTTVKFDYLSTISDADSLHKIVPAGSIESELQGNNYVVEYNQETGAVHAVWYWEKGSNFKYKENYTDNVENAKAERIKAPVGYYGGEGVDRIAVNQMPIPKMTLINAEELKLDISMSLKNTSGISKLNTKVDITISDSEGHKQTIIEGASLVDDTTTPDNLKGSLVLDTLKNYTKKEISTSDSTLENIGNKFKDWVTANPDIKPGDNITVSVKLYYDGTDRALIPQVASVATNSLFANVTADGTAEIAYGRHLQNLDNDEYGITKAKQTRNIDFKATGTGADAIYCWNSTYGYETLLFIPINTSATSALTEYDGVTYEIRNLNIGNPTSDPDANLGLFGSIYGVTTDVKLENITLVNTMVDKQGGDVGALAGFMANGSLDNCHVYLDEFDSAGSRLADKGPRLQGQYAGGLVGMVSNSVELKNCSASTVISSTNQAGGLVGNAGGDFFINNSYAACNITGAFVGGLVGMSENIEINNSYAAGTVDIHDGMTSAVTSMAVSGLFNSSTTATKAVAKSYAAVRYGENVIKEAINVNGAYSGAGTGGSVFYVEQSGVTYETGSGESKNTSELAGKIGGTEFTAAEGWFVPDGGSKVNPMGLTYPYNTLDTDLADPYPYPMLVADATAGSAAMEHYGDWLEDAGGDAMMAYIEKYDDGSYGIYAAKKAVDGKVTTVTNSLKDKDKVVVDDFYRFIGPSDPGEFTLDDGTDKYTFEEETVSDAKLQEAIGDGMKVFKPQSVTGWDGVKNYYHKIKLNSGTTYLYNPSFACEAFDVTEYVAPDSAGNPTKTIATDVILEKPDAAGAGESFTDGAGNSNEATGVVIRSARQLANIQAYTTAADAPQDATGTTVYGQTWVYDQLANIVFSGTNEYTGSGLTVGKASGTTDRLLPAKLTTGKYYGHEKEIKNLYIGTATDGAGLFESVGTGGILQDMRLVNVSVAGDGALATGGLVGILYGTVDDCGIYVSDATEYSNWTVTGSGTNGVGGLIGEISSNAEAKSSFAAVQVDGTGTAGTGQGPTGGFAGQISGTGKVDKCYAGGFVEEDPTTSKLAYLADSANVTGGGNVGGFVGNAADGSQFDGVNYSTASVKGPTGTVGLFAGDMNKPDPGDWAIYAIASAFDSTGSSTAPRDESDYMGGTATGEPTVTAEPYNQTETTFPYPSGQKVHHGDWIEFDVFGLYYDTVGTTTGYYANGNKVDGLDELFSGTPGDKNYATDDGYMFVTVENLGDISIRVGEKSFPMKPVELNPTMEINGKTYKYKYEVPAEALNTPTTNYYNAVSINGKMFYANFGVAGEIFDSVTDPNKPMAKSGIKYTTVDAGVTKTEELKDSASTGYTGVVVRSARQLANIGIATNNGTEAGEAMQGMRFEQVLDIDFDKYAAVNKAKMPSVKDKTTSGGDYNHVPITLKGASARYDGNGYTVRNLRPGTLVDGNFAENGMFGSVKGGATLEGITLVNARVVTDGADNGVMGDGASEDSVHSDTEPYVLNVKTDMAGAGTFTSGSTWGTSDYFTVLQKSDSTSKVETSDELTWTKDGSEVYSSDTRINFGGQVSKTNSAIKFTTSKKAIVKVWWTPGADGRSICIKKDNSAVATSNKYDKGTAQFDVFELNSAGTYDLGGNGTNSQFYRVEVYLFDVTYDPDDPTPYVAPAGSGDAPAEIPDGADISGKRVRAGALAGIVDGSSVINCGAYIEREFDSDGNEIKYDSGKKEAYDYFIVKNAFKGSNEDYVGGLIGNVANSPNVTGSFAAVKVLGVQNAGGFAGKLGGTTTVTNCYVGGHTLNGTYYEGKDKPLKNITTSDETNVTTSGGFAGQSDTAVTFSGVVYTTASVGMAENTNASSEIGRFIGNGATPTKDTTNDTTLYATGIMARKDTVIGGGEEVSFKVGSDTVKVKFGQTEDYLDETVTMRGDNVGTEAGAYDDALTMDYPYLVANDKTPMLKQKIHHGDWPVRVNFVYYELYKDDPSNTEISALPSPTGYTEHIGVYGVFETADPDKPLVVNTLITKGDVYESGYMITAPIQMEYVDFRAVSHYTKEGEGETNSWTGAQVKLEDLGLSSTPLGDNGKYCYLIPAEQLNKAPSDEYYMRAYVNGGLYLINPHFACEILNVTQVVRGSDGTYDLKLDKIRPKLGMKYYNENDILKGDPAVDPDGVTLDGVVIRSAWNFASIARYTRPSNNGKTKDTIVNSKFYQLLDIDFTAYKDGQIYDGNENNRIINGSNKKYDAAGQNFTTGLAPAYLKNGGLYEGYGHTISNVYLMNDSGKENYYTGLFVLSGATVQNLKLDNIHSNVSRIKNNEKVYVGILAGKVDGNSTITNVEITNGEIDLHKVPSWSKDDDKFSEPDNRADEHVVDVGGIGAVAGLLNGGTVDNVTVSGLTVNLNSGKYYYKITKNAPVEQSETSGTDFKQYGTVVKKDSAISIGGAIGDIDTTGTAGAKATVTNVYVVNPEIHANKGNGDFVGGLVGRADGKKDTDTYNAANRDKITISGSGVYLTDAVVKDGTNVTDNFNTKYGVIANDKSSFVGGFVGRTDHYVSVDNCFSAIRVEGAGSVGGFAGHIEGSVIDSCYSGGHTVDGVYKLDDTATAPDIINVKGGSGSTGGFAGKVESSGGGLELRGTIYSTSSVTGTGTEGRFQGGKDNVNAVKKAAEAGGATVYAVGKTAKSVTAIDEKDYLVNYPGNTGTVKTHAYDPEITEEYPYANSTNVSLDGGHAHYGDWEKYSANAAFYWEREGSEYHFYAVLTDSNGETTVENRLCKDHHDDGHGIDAWGYGVFSSDNAAVFTTTGFTDDTNTDVEAAVKAAFGTAKKVQLIKGTTAKDSEHEVTVNGATFYINPAYAAAVSKNESTMGTSAGDNAYQIRHVQQLDNIGESVDTYFEQTHDVSGIVDGGTKYSGYTPNSLNGGMYDGGSYRILDLDITATGSNGAALFSALENAEINHTILYDTDGNGAISGDNAAGIVASMNGGSIKNSIVAGYTITGKTVGGLAAETEGAVSIENSEATVRRKVNEAGGYIGGLVGQVAGGTTTIKSSYAGGDVVTASGVTLNKDMTYLGGIVGGKATGANVKYDTVYSYVAMIEGSGEGKLDFDNTKVKNASGKDTSDFEFVTFYGIGPDVDITKTDTIGFWSGGIPDLNTKDRALSTALVNLAAWKAGNVAKEVYMPNAKDYVTDASALTNIVSGRPFPYGGYVKDANGDPIHYGDWPVAEKYAGLFYWEKERVTSVNESGVEHTDEEYHFYAYGAELVRGELFESDLLENICHEHHFNERATILDSGYGYFLPTASVGGDRDFTFSVMQGTTDVTANNVFGFDGESDTTVVKSIKEELFKKLLLEGTMDGYEVYILNDSGSVDLNKFAQVKDYMWKITANVGTGTKAFDMRVYPTFGEAIYGDDFDMGDGNDDNMEDVEPMKIRTRLQFERLKDNADNKSLDYIRLTHDIDFAEDEAKGYKAGVNDCTFVDKDKTNYVPGQLRTQIFDGQGYRLFDVMISVNNKAESKNYETDDTTNRHHTDEIEFFNNPDGDAALFLNSRDANVTTFKGIVLYSPENKGVIETSVEGGSAAGIVAKEVSKYISYDKDDKQKTTQSKYGFDNCVVSGYTIKGSAYVGGLVGMAVNSSNENIKNSQTYVNLVGTKKESKIGGLAGEWRTSIQNSYTGGAIKLEGATATTDTVIGGIVGNMPNSNSIKDCYTYMNFLDSSINAASVYPLGKGTSGGDNNYYYGEFTKDLANLKTDKQGTEAAKLQDLVDAEKSTADVDYSYWPETKDNYYGYVANAMGTFPFRAVASCEKMSVHYGQWPESTKAAGVVYYEKYEDGGYGLQILGLDSNGAELSIDTLCDGKHVGGNGKITEHRIVSSGYAVFTTDSVNMPVSNLALTVGTDDGARKAIADAVNGIFPDGGIKVYPTGTSGGVATDYTATVKAGSKTLTVYYTNGFAGVSEDKMGGTDTRSFQIRTVRQLDNIPDSDTSGKYFEQTHDLYGDPTGGTKYSGYTGAVDFAGTYDGQGYKILDLSMSGTDKHVGLFASINANTCELRNIIMYAPNGATITGTGTKGVDATDDHYGVGGLVGSIGSGISATAKIENCVVAGYTIKGEQYVGGLIGWGYHGATIKNCAAVNDIECTTIVATKDNENGADNSGAGGILGGYGSNSAKQTSITNCYTGGTIKVSDNNASNAIVGGIVGADGSTAESHASVKNCYTYVDLHECAKAKVSVISASENSSNANNYYLNDNARVPNWVHKQGEGKTYDELKSALSGADFGTATKSYVTKDKRAGEVEKSVDGMTLQTSNFPFPEVVRTVEGYESDGSTQYGNFVHYGEWPKHEPIKEAVNGIFYWEKHGTEYHIQYIGQNEAGNDVPEVNKLCKDRDGTGIEESGFGYFSYGGATATPGDHGVAVDGTALESITKALKAPDMNVYEKVEVTAYKTGTATGNQTWSFTANGHTVTSYVNNAYAKVYSGSSAPTKVEIRTYAQLALMHQAGSVNFEQTHDIDASASSSGSAYTPPETLASGKSYDGGGYRILELTITGSGSDSVGLFGTVKGTVENVVLYSQSGNATISNGRYSGGISGTLSAGKINNCVVAGYKTISGTQYVGGIAGQISDNGEITNCQAVNALEAGSNTSGGIGGIAGNVKGTIENCYAGGKITNALVSSKELKTSVGGIYGKQNSSATAENCYSYMDLTEISNDTIDKYNGKFSSIGPGSNTDCYYLASKFPTEGTAQGEKLETSTSLSGFGKADRSYAPVVPSTDDGVIGNGLTAMSDSFPYPAVFEYNGQKEHYGTWVGTTASGDPGMPEGPGFEGAMAPAVTEAIMPEKFKLPEPENIDENGDDGHTQVVGGRMSVAKVRRVR